MGSTEGHLAVLTDGDNVPFNVIAGLMAAVANYGTASVRRIYGDWTTPNMEGWRECLLEHSIVPIQQFAYTSGKNATDGAMIIDAMDLLYTGRFSSFCLVSSDSDFTRLAARIREEGISVYGFGSRNNTHRAFVAACNEFVYFDALPMQTAQPEELTVPSSKKTAKQPFIPLDGDLFAPTASGSGTPSSKPPFKPLRSRFHPIQPLGSPSKARQPPDTGLEALPHRQPPSFPLSSQHWAHIEPTQRPLDQAALDGLGTAIQSSRVYEDDFVNLAEAGHYLAKISPDLNPRNHGFARLRDFVMASGFVQLKMIPSNSGPAIALVRLKD